MEITLEQVERLREKADVSYGQAKAALEYSGGNLLDALIYLEEQGVIPRPEDAYYSTKNEAPPPPPQELPVLQVKPEAKQKKHTRRGVRHLLHWLRRILLDNELEIWRKGQPITAVPMLILLIFVIFFFLLGGVSILHTLQHVALRTEEGPFARELREADRFRRELLFVLRHEEPSSAENSATFAEKNLCRVDAERLGLTSPLPLLVPGETVGFRWQDTPPDTRGDGILVGPGPVDLWLGQKLSESDWKTFGTAMERLLQRQWRPAAVTEVSDGPDDALLRRIWIAKVVDPASGREMVQAWAVTPAYEGIPLFFFAQRTVRGDTATAVAVVTESLRSLMVEALPYGRLEQMERNVVCALALNNPLLLCALLVGWFFARELGFVLLCAVGLATIFTLGCKLLELLGVPISVNLTMLVEFFSLNSLLCIGVALAAAVAGRLCRGRQLEEEVRQVESEVIQRLEGQAELSKQEEILLGMAAAGRDGSGCNRPLLWACWSCSGWGFSRRRKCAAKMPIAASRRWLPGLKR